MKVNIIYNENCLETMARMDDNSINCIVTSPPYWGLRQYLFDGAVAIKNDITEDELNYLMMELEKNGIKPELAPK